MKLSIKKGFSFGLTSGVITTLGLIVGLNAGTHSRLVVINGILVIAITDALSDALGIHISEECESGVSTKQIWVSTLSTFFSKFIFALTFIIPIILFSLSLAVNVSIIWGLFLIVLFSFIIAKRRKVNPIPVVLEHLILAVFVVFMTCIIGHWISGLKF